MEHIKVTFKISNGQESEMLMAALAEAGYDGFEELENELLAYIPADTYDEAALKNMAGDTSYEATVVAEQNWNAVWESNFEPVIVKGLCTIRAHFHDIVTDTPYVINITPKMSFGTGHHATTQQVMLLMKDVDLTDKRVLDFGTGTGVLAILAEMMGAKQVYAIDNDEWSVENAIENGERNDCKRITIAQGSLEDVPAGQTDVILANINRNILLQYMTDLYDRLVQGGTILLSGLLAEDREIMMKSATEEGFKFIKGTEQGNWIALQLEK